MIGLDAKQVRSASLNEVVEVLSARGKDGALSYEQQIALDHAKKFALSDSKYEAAKKSMEELKVLQPSTITSVLNVMPKNEPSLRQVLAGAKQPLDDELVGKVFEIVKKASV